MKKFYKIMLLMILFLPLTVFAGGGDDDKTEEAKKIYECNYTFYMMDGIELPLSIALYDNSEITYYSNGNKLNAGNNMSVEFSNGNSYIVSLPKTDSFKEKVKLSSGYKCPNMFSLSSSGIMNINIGDAGDDPDAGQYTAKINNEWSAEGVTKIEVNQQCSRGIRKEINHNELNLNFDFKMYTDGSKEVCVKNVDVGTAGSCSKSGSLTLDIEGTKQLWIDVDTDSIFKQYANMNVVFVCPDTIYLGVEYADINGSVSSLLTTNEEEANKFGNTGEVVENPDNNGNSSNNTPNLGTEVTGCDVVPDVVRKWIKIALNFVKYVSLILVIVLGTLDFIKAAGSGEADSMKKAGEAFLKRVVAVILLFLLPMLVELILDLINLYGTTGDCFGVLE